jgi:hypothetical protein
MQQGSLFMSKPFHPFHPIAGPLSLFLLLLLLAVFIPSARAERMLVISVPDQKLAVVEDGENIAEYPVSTSRFGLGDRPSSFATPLGSLSVAGKIGAGLRTGAVFKGRRPTGEILRPNAPGRDPIVTRIIHLRGLERQNARAYSRGIYIHGTPVERRIGRPESYGCIRMRSRDVIAVFDAVRVGTRVQVVDEPLEESAAPFRSQGRPRFARN